jgi:hypothetical protein
MIARVRPMRGVACKLTRLPRVGGLKRGTLGHRRDGPDETTPSGAGFLEARRRLQDVVMVGKGPKKRRERCASHAVEGPNDGDERKQYPGDRVRAVDPIRSVEPGGQKARLKRQRRRRYE